MAPEIAGCTSTLIPRRRELGDRARVARDRLDERGAARALGIAQSTWRDTRKLYYVSHRLILQGI
jgi:hypothetical protein